ncbi:MAG: hypothetical protein ACETVZ_02680 [Phycisphaerae bacterium]
MNLAHSTALRTSFGGWVDEKAELVREAGPHVSTEKSTGHL